MLVEVERIAKAPGSPVLAEIRTAFGRTAVCWCGDPEDPPGRYTVEWTIDEEITWGRNATPAAEPGPAMHPGDHIVRLCGRLELMVEMDEAASLDLDGTPIQLDLAEPLPEGVDGSWVELHLEREKIALYPYQV